MVVPCHRVVATDGSFKGYAWGLHRKRWLLEHEKVIPEPGKETAARLPGF
jgi:methylated-DNA-[protein]-cysteine S-methyltransferase